MVKGKTILKWLVTTVWIAVGAGVIVLLVAAIQKEDQQKCSGITVTIKGVSNNFFVDKDDILKALNDYIEGSPVGQPLHSFNLVALETELQKNIWVKKIQLFFDSNNRLQVNVLEREPVARVFTNTGTTFYIDSSLAMLPLSEKFSARLPVFTNFPSDKAVLTKADSVLLKNIFIISTAIQKDPFRMAMIEQVDITAQRNFEFLPKIGNTTILFGDATKVEEKFSKLLLFYKNVMTKCGWNYYSVVNVQYANQVVAKRKGAEDKTADSLRTLQLMQLIAYTAEQQANDSMQMFATDNEQNSTDINLIQQSMQRDDNAGFSTASETTNLRGIPVISKNANTNLVPMKNPFVAEKNTGLQNQESKSLKPIPEKKTVLLQPNKSPVMVKTAIKKTVKPVAAKNDKNDY